MKTKTKLILYSIFYKISILFITKNCFEIENFQNSRNIFLKH